MHGNESTSTKSLLDFINALNDGEFTNILDACTLEQWVATNQKYIFITIARLCKYNHFRLKS